MDFRNLVSKLIQRRTRSENETVIDPNELIIVGDMVVFVNEVGDAYWGIVTLTGTVAGWMMVTWWTEGRTVTTPICHTEPFKTDMMRRAEAWFADTSVVDRKLVNEMVGA